MNIGIIGTRGIPNRYGGFEQLAEQLSVGLFQNGHRVTVYNSHKHPFQLAKFKGVDIVHCYDAEQQLGTIGQFIYDLNCIRDARKKNFDVLLFLGYTSSSIWGSWYPKGVTIISNMDGLEWKREKYSKPVRSFLRLAEKLAVTHSDHLIADSPVIASYLQNKYGINSKYIAYGAIPNIHNNESILEQFSLCKKKYFMLMARMEPENKIEMILNGFHNSNSVNKFVVVGNTHTRYGRYIKGKYGMDSRIHFAGAVFDNRITQALISFSRIYFHGHSTGGTNPSLLEAMAAGALIASHDNEFNRAVLQDDALYFKSAPEISEILKMDLSRGRINEMPLLNLQKIKEKYNWTQIIDQYEKFILQCFNSPKK